MSKKILNTIGEVYTQEAKEILDSLGTVDLISWSQEKLLKNISEYEIAVIGLGLNFDRAVLEKASHLKVIATATTGLDHIDVEYAKERGIEVLSLRGEDAFLNTITSTAELALGLMLDTARMISLSFESVKQGQWNRDLFRGHSLFGHTLGIVGFGRLGQMMARYGLSLGMKVIAFDPYLEKDVFAKANVEKVDFDVLLQQSDVVSVHVHLNENTENMFVKETFQKMKTGSYLINTSRGKIVHEEDLIEALEEKRIAGYGTDVLSEEIHFGKTILHSPLVEYAKSHGNVVITPHIGGMTFESRELTDVFMAEKLKKYLSR